MANRALPPVAARHSPNLPPRASSPTLSSTMPAKKSPTREHIQYHKSGTIWAKGQMIGDLCVGYWEWFRLDGTKLRSGHFENGEQAGQWTTYDKNGEVYKITTIKPKPPAAAKPAPAPKSRTTPKPAPKTKSKTKK